MMFKEELRDLINKHSKENESNTPDFILASYMETCLKAFDKAIQRRESWYRDCYKRELDDLVGGKHG